MANEQIRNASVSQNEKSISFAVWLRAAATIMILLCHFCSQKGGFLFNAAAQVLNIGVPLFFILSGYLFGRNGVQAPYRKWFIRRLQRLWIPYWMFLAALAVVHLVKGLDVLTMDWLLLLFGLQGSIVGVWGAEQTWFISALLICYGMTPWISIAAERMAKKHVPILLICLSTFPIFLLLMKPVAIGTLLAPVCLYTVAYYIGGRIVTVNINRVGACLAALIVFASFGLRFALRIFFDGTVFYSGIVATYTHYAASLAIFYLFAWFFAERKPVLCVTFIGNISFEVYLYHYMFTVGPVSVFSTARSWTVNCILAFGITVVVATVMHFVAAFLEKRIFVKMR